MQLINKLIEDLGSCVIDIFSKYAWVVPLKDKKVITITNALQKIIKESNTKTKQNMG